MYKLFKITSLCFLLTQPLFGEELISPKTDSLIQAGIRLSVQQSFDAAYTIFSEMKNDLPENPVGYFFCAAVVQSQMMDAENYDRENEFFGLINKAIELSNLQLKKNRRDARAYFFLGSGYGYLSFYKAKKKNFVESFQIGLKSVKALEMALKIDPTLYDAYLGLGTYKYYRSKLSRHFTWLPFVSDERAAGIAMLKKAVQKGKYARYSAMNSFCWVALDEELYEDGWRMVQSALKEFPDSRFFLWCAAKLAAKLEYWQKSIDYYEKILTSFKMQNVVTPYNEYLCRRHLHQLYIEQKNYLKANRECEKIQQIQLDERTRARLAELLNEVQESCSQLSKKSLIGKRGG